LSGAERPRAGGSLIKPLFFIRSILSDMTSAFEPHTLPREAGDYTDRRGAEKLKRMIEDYWRQRGYDIQVTLVPGAFTAALRASRFDLRSELVNGLPRRCCASGSPCSEAA
jgi:hypothetical protein